MPSNHLVLCRPLSLLLQPFSASGSFPVSRLLASGGQRIRASASASVPAINQDWFPLGLTDLISLQSKGLSRVSSNSAIQKHQFFGAQPSLWPKYHTRTCTTGKAVALTIQTFLGKVMTLLFNMLSRFGITFLPRRTRLLISWLQSPSAVILEAKKIKSDTFPLFPHLFAMKWWYWRPWS